ncbi:MAG: hypothetical protein ACI4E4_06745, partial [Acetatifactor sp.]
WAADESCVSLADDCFLRPHCGETLGLQTSPVSLLQTVGEPSVLGARTLCPYVPLRAKPKRKRVCTRDTGLGTAA